MQLNLCQWRQSLYQWRLNQLKLEFRLKGLKVKTTALIQVLDENVISIAGYQKPLTLTYGCR